MSSLGIRVAWEPLRILDSATLTGSYIPFGGPLEHNCYLIKVVNESGVDVLISVDGTTDVDICPSGGFFLYDECSNASREGGLSVHKWTQFWINGSASTGNIYLVAQYAEI